MRTLKIRGSLYLFGIGLFSLLIFVMLTMLDSNRRQGWIYAAESLLEKEVDRCSATFDALG